MDDVACTMQAARPNSIANLRTKSVMELPTAHCIIVKCLWVCLVFISCVLNLLKSYSKDILL